MKIFRKQILIFFFLWFVSVPSLKAQKIVKYKGAFELKEDRLTIEGKITLTFDRPTEIDSIQLYLNNTAGIDKIMLNEMDVEFSRKPPKQFLDDVDLFSISTSQMNQRANELYLSYHYRLNEIQHPNFTYRPDWIELNLYTGWYPFNLESKSFSYQIDFQLPDSYKLVSKRKVEREGDTWKLYNSGENMDIVCLLANDLKTVVSQNNSIVIYYTDFEVEQMNQLVITANKICQLFKTKFGAKESDASLTIMANPFNSPMSYARRNLISISTQGRLKLKDELTLAHEIGHLWWNNATYGSYEEWLNESFAELSKLVWLKNEYGKEEVNTKLSEYRLESSGSAAIQMVSPNHPQWYKVAYLKGALILWEFMESVGDTDFFALCRAMTKLKISRTDQLLELISTEIGVDETEWLYNKISQ